MDMLPKLCLLVLVALLTPAWGQVSASISGKVEDASNAAVRGATVTVKSLETGATRVVTSDDSGNYRALALAVGPHEVRAAKPGFKTAIRERVDLVVGQNAVVNLQLELGEVTQEVTVSGEPPVVNVTTASVS